MKNEKSLGADATEGVNAGSIAAPSATARHTPGPWYVSDGREMHTTISGGRTHDVICRVVNGATADRDLIAAAPEMYEALKSLLADIEDYQRINHLGGKNNHAQVLARAALAKAEGRS